MSHEDRLRQREQGHLNARFVPKRAFGSKHAAKVYLARARGPIQKDQLQPYRCFVCEQWHLGNKRSVKNG